MDLSTAIARLLRHRQWAARTLRFATASGDDNLLEVALDKIAKGERTFRKVVLDAADDEANKTRN
jgi:hypothetical protein